MIAINSRYIIILIISLFIVTTSAANEKFVKKYHHDFVANQGDMLEISNKFGMVEVFDHDKNEVNINVEIQVEAWDQERANEIFEQIKINFGKEGSTLKAITEIDGSFNNVNFSINYKVYMPASLNLSLSNKYGDVFVSKLTSLFSINVKYGSFKADKLQRGNSKPYSTVNLEYSGEGSRITECNWLKIDISFSKIEIVQSTALMLISKYSKLNIGNTNSLVTDSKYDNYHINSVNQLVINGIYSGYEVGFLETLVESNQKYSDLKIFKTGNKVEKVIIDNQYGNVKIGLSTELSYSLDVKSQYCNVSYPSSQRLNIQKDNTSQVISGYIGNQNSPTTIVKIKTKYGDVKLK